MSSRFEFNLPSANQAFREINDEVFEGDGSGLEEEEFNE